MTACDVSDVFRPRAFPTLTYVNRYVDTDETYEAMLKRALRNTGTLIAVSGASKTGKTVLCHKVLPADSIVDLSGGQIATPDDFWEQIAEKLAMPVEYQFAQDTRHGRAVKGSSSAGVSLPLLGRLTFAGGAETSSASGNNIFYKMGRSRTALVQYMIDHKLTLIIDDFHYIDKEVQIYIARTLKTEIFKGLRAIILSLPHRSDDAIRMNPDLIGRTTFIDLAAWSMEDLQEIARKGFEQLQLPIEAAVIEEMAQEADSSPLLMQEICLNLAGEMVDRQIKQPDRELLRQVFRATAKNYQHYRDILQRAYQGPMQGRTRRKQYTTATGKTYDVYGLLLTSISSNPPILRLPLDELQRRIRRILGQDDIPNKLTIANAVKHLSDMIKTSLPKHDTIDTKDKTLYILDPMLLFYLRWSSGWKID